MEQTTKGKGWNRNRDYSKPELGKGMSAEGIPAVNPFDVQNPKIGPAPEPENSGGGPQEIRD